MGDPNSVTLAYVCQDEVAHSWHRSVMDLVGFDGANNGRLTAGGYIVIRCGTDGLPEARNKAVAEFLKEDKADWLFWIDTDMGFLPDTIDRLFDAADPIERPIVGALCFGNSEIGPDGVNGYECVASPTVLDWAKVEGPDGGEQYGWRVRWDFKTNTVTRVGGTGAACILIHRSVFEKLEAAHGRAWYHRVPNVTTGQLIGEDLSFCLRAGALDIPIYVHTGVPTTHLKPVWLGEDTYWTQRAIASAQAEFANLEPAEAAA